MPYPDSYRLLNCDAEGVPNLVQRADYHYSSMMWVFHLFNDQRITMYEERVPVQGIDLMTTWVLPEQIQDAKNWFTEMFETDEDFRENLELYA